MARQVLRFSMRVCTDPTRHVFSLRPPPESPVPLSWVVGFVRAVNATSDALTGRIGMRIATTREPSRDVTVVNVESLRLRRPVHSLLCSTGIQTGTFVCSRKQIHVRTAADEVGDDALVRVLLFAAGAELDGWSEHAAFWKAVDACELVISIGLARVLEEMEANKLVTLPQHFVLATNHRLRIGITRCSGLVAPEERDTSTLVRFLATKQAEQRCRATADASDGQAQDTGRASAAPHAWADAALDATECGLAEMLSTRRRLKFWMPLFVDKNPDNVDYRPPFESIW